MDHVDFIRLWKEGKLLVDVDRTKALQVVGSKIMPMRYQLAHAFWSWVWLLTIPIWFSVMYFYAWWAGLLGLFFITPLISRATKTAAMQFIIERAVDSKEFFDFAVSTKTIEIRHKKVELFDEIHNR
jgi:hypothetical protein